MYLNVENFRKYQMAVIHKCDHDEYNDLVDGIKSFIEYPKAVMQHEKTLELRRNQMDSSELIQIIQDADQNRRIVHNNAIVNCAIMNRLAEIYNVGKVFTGDIACRYQVGDFCEEVAELFFGYEMQKNIYNHENYKIFMGKANDADYSMMNEFLSAAAQFFIEYSKLNVDVKIWSLECNEIEWIEDGISLSFIPLRACVKAIMNLTKKYNLIIFDGNVENDDDIRAFCAEVVAIPFKKRHK